MSRVCIIIIFFVCITITYMLKSVQLTLQNIYTFYSFHLTGFQPLDVVAMSKIYRTARHRLIVLDWGGTLVVENDKVSNSLTHTHTHIYVHIYAYTHTLSHSSKSTTPEDINIII